MIKSATYLVFFSQPEIENHIWITAYRKEIPVQLMSTLHIKNCIKCLLGIGSKEIPNGYLGGKKKWLKIFKQELITRN